MRVQKLRKSKRCVDRDERRVEKASECVDKEIGLCIQ
jgi:hypothetical protein